jgi:hypothetical protein
MECTARHDATKRCLCARRGSRRTAVLRDRTGQCADGHGQHRPNDDGDGRGVLARHSDDRAHVVVVHGLPVRVNELASTPMTALTTAEPRHAADRYCADFPACRPVAVEREVFSNRAVVTRWDDASGTLRDL